MAINNREEIMQLGMDEGSDTEEGNPRLQLTHEELVERHKRKMLLFREQMQRDPPHNCITVAPRSEDELFVWDAAILGPIDSPYEGSIFHLVMEFEACTNQSPNVYFTTPIFHPNVDPNGQIGLDFPGTGWTVAQTIPTILSSICALLSNPNPHQSLNAEATQLFLAARQQYNESVQQWTRNHSAHE